MKKMSNKRVELREMLYQYIPHKERLDSLEKELLSVKNDPNEISLLLEEKRIITAYMEECKKIYDDIKECCGERAAKVVWDSYAMRMGAVNVALKYGMSKRSYEVWVDFWLDKHDLIDETVKNGESPWVFASEN